MFITNKRVIIPEHLYFGDIRLIAVKKFKLLGFIIDSKLEFELHVAQTCLSINRKLDSIKRLFFLPFKVKI
jgi:hypothetical protein